jgi:hypothetical protein
MKILLRTIAGVVLGYGSMVVLITLVQETWFGGVARGETPFATLLAAGLLTCVAALIGAVAATAIARPGGRAAAVIMCCLVAIETTVLVVTGRVGGPLWFDIAAAASLILAILLGAELVLRWSATAGALTRAGK